MQPSRQSHHLTLSERILVGVAAGASSSFINHPFQVLRSRFQNHVAFKEKFPLETPPVIFTKDPKILFKGFFATLLSMCCLTVTQSVAKRLIRDANSSDGAHLSVNIYASILGGGLSALLTTPLEGSILRQSKTLTSNGVTEKQGVFKSAQNFYKHYGFAKSYVGCTTIALRTAIVGSGFAVWMPAFTKELDKQEVPHNVSVMIAGVIAGLMAAAASQPFEGIRIEQQFTADERRVLTFRESAKGLFEKNGFSGLFKGGSYRIPRTAPGVLINGFVYEKAENYFKNRPGLR